MSDIVERFGEDMLALIKGVANSRERLHTDDPGGRQLTTRA
jgi:hypothetical protein